MGGTGGGSGKSREKILRERAERRDMQRPRLPWHARVWAWFSPSSIARDADGNRDRSADGRHVLVIFGVVLLVLALVALTAFNVWRALGGGMGERLVIADAIYAAGQEANVIDDLSSQGFSDAHEEKGLGIVALGTYDMVSEYRQSFSDLRLAGATETLSEGTEKLDKLGIAAASHSDAWDSIELTTYMDTADVDLFQYVLTNDPDVEDALDMWIAWGVMQNGEGVTFSFVDATGTRYFESNGISSVADVIVAAREKGVEGIDWDEVANTVGSASSDGSSTDAGGTSATEQEG